MMHRLHLSHRLVFIVAIVLQLRTDIPVTNMMTRSYAEFATQRALGGKDVPRLLAQGERRLRELRAQAEAIPCIRADGDGRLDTEVLDIEEIASDGTAGALSRSTALARSGSTAAAAAARMNDAIRVLQHERCQSPSHQTRTTN